MTEQVTSPQTPAETPADRIAAAVLSVPGVAGLHGGSFGEVGTYLAGRRVVGVRIGDEVTEVHVTVAMGTPVLELGDAVAAAVQPLVDSPVQVFVEDVEG